MVLLICMLSISGYTVATDGEDHQDSMVFQAFEPRQIAENFSDQYLKTVTFAIVDGGGSPELHSFYQVRVSEYLHYLEIELSEEDRINVPLDAALEDGMVIQIDRVYYTYVSRQIPLPYPKQQNEVQTIPKGTQRLLQSGVDGMSECFIEQVNVNGKLEDEFILSQKILTQPIPEMTEIGVGGTITGADGAAYAFSYYKEMESTAYTYVPGKTTKTTATGAALKKGVVAVDPDVIPLNTKLYIKGTIDYGYGVACDTGGVIKGNIIDLAFETYNECVDYGRRNVRVYILE